MLKKYSFSLLIILLLSFLSFAKLSNVKFLNDTTVSNDLFSFMFESTRDTVYTQVWLETTDDTFLTNQDRKLVTIVMIDNNTNFIENGNTLIFPDADTAKNKFLFGPLNIDFPPGRFYGKFIDADDSIYKPFIIVAPVPKITISGKITTPEGISNRFIWVEANSSKDNKSLQAMTDENGVYILNIDSATVNSNESLYIKINMEWSGLSNLISTPSNIIVSTRNGNVDSVNFSLKLPSNYIAGKVTDLNNNPVMGIEVGLNDNNYNRIVSTTTNDSGEYILPASQGQYRLNLYSENSINGYMTPKDTEVVLSNIDTLKVNLKVAKCDTFIYCIIRKDGDLFSGNFGLDVWSTNNNFSSHLKIKNSSNIVYVSKSFTYNVWLNFGYDNDTIPQGYVLKANNNNVKAGDTVYFDFVKPHSVIKGIVKNNNSQVIPNCIVTCRNIETNEEFKTSTDSMGIYSFNLKDGYYSIEVDYSIFLKGYMRPASEDIALKDTVIKDIILLSCDTAIYGKILYKGEKPKLKLGIYTMSIDTFQQSKYESVTINDSLGNFILPVSKNLLKYNVTLLFGMGFFDTLQQGDSIVGGVFKMAKPGDTLIFEIINSSVTANIKAKKVFSYFLSPVKNTKNGLLISFALPKQSNVNIEILDFNGRLLFSPINGIYSSGRHNVYIPRYLNKLSKAGYIIRMKWENGQISKKFIVLN